MQHRLVKAQSFFLEPLADLILIICRFVGGFLEMHVYPNSQHYSQITRLRTLNGTEGNSCHFANAWLDVERAKGIVRNVTTERVAAPATPCLCSTAWWVLLEIHLLFWKSYTCK